MNVNHATLKIHRYHSNDERIPFQWLYIENSLSCNIWLLHIQFLHKKKLSSEIEDRWQRNWQPMNTRICSRTFTNPNAMLILIQFAIFMKITPFSFRRFPDFCGFYTQMKILQKFCGLCFKQIFGIKTQYFIL